MKPPELEKLICGECRHSVFRCICAGPKKANAITVRVFTEDDVREGYERLEAGEPLAALDFFRELLDEERSRHPIMRRA